MSNRSGQAYALMVWTPIRDGEAQPLREYLAKLPTGENSPLARLGTTHFARWLVLPDLVYQGPPQEPDHLQSPYLLFTSNFDGELEPYLTALGHHLGDEADQIWGRCVGYPGSNDRDAFAAYLRRNQIDSTFFYSAYPDATVAAVRDALHRRERVIQFAISSQGLPPAQLRAAYDEYFGKGR
jgi:hypothetical protein